TALFLGGAYAAAALFPGSAIPRIVERLHDRVDFGIMRTNGGATPLKQTLSMGWTPEAGYIPYDWDIYSEHLILYLLGLGHPSRPLEAASWEGWERRWGESGEWSEVLGGGLPLFIHQYNFLYLDPRTVPLGGIDLFQNSRRATLLD